MRLGLSMVFAVLLGIETAAAQLVQQGAKLVGTGAAGAAYQGVSVALSADGNTAIVGGPYDNTEVPGAGWFFTRTGGVWSQQGSKLVGTGAVGSARQGSSVALSADGNTAIVGGRGDNGAAGAAWIFTRSGGVWSQQGSKLVGTGAVGNAFQGFSVALSADGNTALVGGIADNGMAGAAWIFTRSGGVWSQQGGKLAGTGAVGSARQGYSVDLSADGNTAIVGGYSDNGDVGAAWIFIRNGVVWSQQGSKLVGTGAVGNAFQGVSVSLANDGNTAIVGGVHDSGNVGAAWIFTRSGGVWSQQGSKLVGTGAVGNAFQGGSVSLANDGNTATVGGHGDNGGAGAAWVFARSSGVWSQQGSKLVGTGAVGAANQGVSASLAADGNTAIVGGWADNGRVGAAWIFAIPTPAGLAFVQQPAVTVAGATISPAVTVQLRDAYGNPAPTAGVTVTLTLTSGTGTLSGTASRSTDASGVATFDDLSIALAGAKQLTAESSGLTSGVSDPFSIVAGAPAAVAVTGGGAQSTRTGTLFPAALEVRVTDALGNPVSGAAVTFTAPVSGASAVLGNGGSAVTDTDGYASVAATANAVPGGPYTVTATAGTAPPAAFALTNLQPIPALGGIGLAALALLVAAAGALLLGKPLRD